VRKSGKETKKRERKEEREKKNGEASRNTTTITGRRRTSRRIQSPPEARQQRALEIDTIFNIFIRKSSSSLSFFFVDLFSFQKFFLTF